MRDCDWTMMNTRPTWHDCRLERYLITFGYSFGYFKARSDRPRSVLPNCWLRASVASHNLWAILRESKKNENNRQNDRDGLLNNFHFRNSTEEVEVAKENEGLTHLPRVVLFAI